MKGIWPVESLSRTSDPKVRLTRPNMELHVSLEKIGQINKAERSGSHTVKNACIY